jgi:protein phosphatase
VGLYAVADGMGGHAAGEVASRLAVEALADLATDAAPLTADDPDRAAELLRNALRDGHQRICHSVAEHEEWRGMGTTVVALLLLESRAIIAHVGDSRAYLWRDGRLQRLTSDHSWVNEQVQLGLLTDEEAHRHPWRNIITRALGNQPDVEVELTQHPIHGGDLYLLCSDGLNSMLADDEIAAALGSQANDPASACRELVERANARGGEDNITVIVLRT